MRPVRGLEQPASQWMLIALGVLLIMVAGAESMGIRRARSTIEELRTANLNARTERQQLETRLAREQAARESFALELGRTRGSLSTAAAPEPTLTLSPLVTRRPTPPDATVAVPPPAQSVLLRLMLPTGQRQPGSRYAIALRSWSQGYMVWSRGDLHTSAIDGKAAVVARLTGDVLAAGAYEIRLTDVTVATAPVDAAFYEIAIGPPGS
jgi:hypothetical protein